MPTTVHRPAARLSTGAGVRRGLAVGALSLLGASAAAPSALTAQEAERPAAASAEVSLGFTTLSGGTSWTASGTALLGLTPRTWLGGGGSVLLGGRSLPGSARGSEQELRIAYGGLVAQLELATRPERRLWVRAQAGAGNAKVDLSLVGTRIASDNFGVFVPEVGGAVRLAGPLHVGAGVGYRFVVGVEDLPGLGPSDLRGFSAGVHLSVHGF